MRMETAPDASPVERLIGGWKDITDDLRAIHQRLAGLTGRCACDHDRESASCPCCADSARRAHQECEVCTPLLSDIADRVGRLEDDTLRFLPALYDLVYHREGRGDAALTFEHAIAQLLGTFRHLRAAADEFSAGCSTSHLPALQGRAEDVATAATRLDGALHKLS